MSPAPTSTPLTALPGSEGGNPSGEGAVMLGAWELPQPTAANARSTTHGRNVNLRRMTPLSRFARRTQSGDAEGNSARDDFAETAPRTARSCSRFGDIRLSPPSNAPIVDACRVREQDIGTTPRRCRDRRHLQRVPRVFDSKGQRVYPRA